MTVDQAMRALQDAQRKIDQRERRLLRLADRSATLAMRLYLRELTKC